MPRALSFSANVSFLFKEVPFLERFARTRRAGFRGVEFMWPAPEDLPGLERAVSEAQLEVALFNFYAGDIPAGDRGLLSDPTRRSAFRENVPIALELADRLECTRLNALAGLRVPDLALERQLDLARENVAWAAEQARPQAATVLIEPVNSFENGPYLLDTADKVRRFVDSVGADNVMIQYDAYHVARMGEDPVVKLEEHLGRVGHAQIADCPGRGEPGTGDVDVRSLLEVLEHADYAGWIGLEYNPTMPTTDYSLSWISDRREASGTDG